MLAAEQGPIHDDPGSILAPLDGAVREFFLHDAPYGQKSVSIHYLDSIDSGLHSLPIGGVLSEDRDQDEQESNQAK